MTTHINCHALFNDCNRLNSVFILLNNYHYLKLFTFSVMSLMHSICSEVCQLLKNVRTHKSCRRYLSSSEVSVALRPFYFAVHPDLFQQHPKERDTNENSLKQLNGYIETLMHSKPVLPSKVKFFLRKQQSTDRQFKAVSISLAQKDIRVAIQTILASCSLSTKYVDNLPKAPQQEKSRVSLKGI